MSPDISTQEERIIVLKETFLFMIGLVIVYAIIGWFKS